MQGAFAVRGWLHVQSYTRPRDNIGRFSHWWMRVGREWQAHAVVEFKPHGNGFVAKLAGIDDRDTVVALAGREIAVSRAELPAPAPGEFYWADLIGLDVRNRQGESLGRVASLLETGANDVLVVRNGEEVLIPFVTEVFVLDVDLDNRTIHVDWPTL